MTLPGSQPSAGRSLSLEDFVVLNDEIRAFVRAGIPLDVGLSGTASRAEGRLSEIAASVSQRISEGRSLEDAIAAEGQAIPAEYRAMLAAGLSSGRLPELLTSLSELGQSIASLRRQLRLSLIYPTIVFVLAYVLFTGFTTFVVPHLLRSQFVFRMEETPVTQILRWLQQSVGIWGPAIPGVLILLWVLSLLRRRLSSRPTDLLEGMRWLPGARDVALSRFACVLSVLVDHNVPLPEACRLCGASTDNESLRSVGERLAQRIEAGVSLANAVNLEPQLPAFLRWLVTVGEQQGALAHSLRQATSVYEQRAMAKLDWFRRLVPPTIVLLFGGTITLLYGLLLFIPMTQLLQSLEEVSR